MAGWMIHFRIADYLINKYDYLDNDYFIVGNIGPDCSIIDEQTGKFEPSFNVTHFTETGRKLDMDIESFYNQYLYDKDLDKHYFCFYLGYYIHLLTDQLWTKLIWLPVKEKYIGEIRSVTEFMNIVRCDWYAQDHIFFRKNTDFKVLKQFSTIEEFENIYLDFYIKDTFTKRIRNISDFYNNFKGELKSEYKYFSELEADKFILKCVVEIEDILKQKGFLFTQKP